MIPLGLSSSVVKIGKYCCSAWVLFFRSVCLPHAHKEARYMILTHIQAWMIASLLPLPSNPELALEPTPSQLDVERQFTSQLGPLDDRSYQKAMWWRNLNRVMAGVGTLLVGVIVSLVKVVTDCM